MLSKAELFPADWSPQTTSCGSATNSPTPFALIDSIWLRRKLELEVRRWVNDAAWELMPLCAEIAMV
jgi:hypothetical protein